MPPGSHVPLVSLPLAQTVSSVRLVHSAPLPLTEKWAASLLLRPWVVDAASSVRRAELGRLRREVDVAARLMSLPEELGELECGRALRRALSGRLVDVLTVVRAADLAQAAAAWIGELRLGRAFGARLPLPQVLVRGIEVLPDVRRIRLMDVALLAAGERPLRL